MSPPDFDIDFCPRRRQEVIDYVARKYGADHVSQIITFGTLAARAAIRDVGRATGMSYADVDVVAPEKGMLRGLVTGVTFRGVHYEIIVDVKGFKWMIQTTDFVAEGETIGLSIDPDAIHIMKKSEYSGKFGDYSTFSDEMDHLSDVVDEEE